MADAPWITEKERETMNTNLADRAQRAFEKYRDAKDRARADIMKAEEAIAISREKTGRGQAEVSDTDRS